MKVSHSLVFYHWFEWNSLRMGYIESQKLMLPTTRSRDSLADKTMKNNFYLFIECNVSKTLLIY